MPSNGKVCIAGAGLAGSYLACLLLDDGYDLELFERRPDMRVKQLDGGRSINLAISKRGLLALERVGLKEAVKDMMIPMRGREIHHLDGSQSFQPYSLEQGEGIHSISRAGLNKLLMSHAESKGAKIHFDSSLTSVDLNEKRMTLSTETGEQETRDYQHLIGTDGAGSVLREALVAKGGKFTPEMLGHGYKELTFPPLEGGGFCMREDALHIWPRGEFMLIALPNPDGSFTGTLFLPMSGDISFESLADGRRFRQFFEAQFADALPFIPRLDDEWRDNPVGSLGTIRMDPWTFGDGALLLGDAAHGVVPFYGQGMNCAFESCWTFTQSLKEKGGDWQACLDGFTTLRKPEADAIATLAVKNFTEMRDHVADRRFLLQKSVLNALEEKVPGFRTEYSLVTFSDAPYSKALQAGELQERLVEEIVGDAESMDQLDWGRAFTMAQEYLDTYQV